jgi:hypothetical protein
LAQRLEKVERHPTSRYLQDLLTKARDFVAKNGLYPRLPPGVHYTENDLMEFRRDFDKLLENGGTSRRDTTIVRAVYAN